MLSWELRGEAGRILQVEMGSHCQSAEQCPAPKAATQCSSSGGRGCMLSCLMPQHSAWSAHELHCCTCPHMMP